MNKWILYLALFLTALSAQAAPFLPGMTERYAPEDYSPYPNMPQQALPTAPGPAPAAPYANPPWGASPMYPGYGYGSPWSPSPYWGGGQSVFPWGGSGFPWSPWGNSFGGSPFGWW